MFDILDQVGERAVQIATKAGVALGGGTALASVANKADWLTLDNIGIVVGIACSVSSVLIAWWFAWMRLRLMREQLENSSRPIEPPVCDREGGDGA